MRLIRKGKSKRKADDNPKAIWELYDMEADWTELNDLADKYPDRVKEMAEMYDAWKRHCGVKDS